MINKKTENYEIVTTGSNKVEIKNHLFPNTIELCGYVTFPKKNGKFDEKQMEFLSDDFPTVIVTEDVTNETETEITFLWELTFYEGDESEQGI